MVRELTRVELVAEACGEAGEVGSSGSRSRERGKVDLLHPQLRDSRCECAREAWHLGHGREVVQLAAPAHQVDHARGEGLDPELCHGRKLPFAERR